MPLRGNSWRQAKTMWGPKRGSPRLPFSRDGLNRRRSVPLNTSRIDSSGAPARKRVLPAVLGDGGEGAGVPQGPAQRRTDVPPGREIVALLRIHVHVAAVHRDDARQAQLARRQNRGRPGRDGPVRVDHVGPVLAAALMMARYWASR